jgi:putative addiction module antidote
MTTVKVTAIGNSLGVILPREVLARLGVDKGDQLHLLLTPGGVELTPFDPEFAEQMGVLEQVVRAEREVLRYAAPPQLSRAVPPHPPHPSQAGGRDE